MESQLVWPFPMPDDRVRATYWNLHLSENGTEEQKRRLGPASELPRPWDIATCTDPDLRAAIWHWYTDVVTWFNHEYVWDPNAGMIPTCWPLHPHLVHEIGVLADQRRRAALALNSNALEEWHRYSVPTFLDRTNERLKQHCDAEHQQWPAARRLAVVDDHRYFPVDRPSASSDSREVATLHQVGLIPPQKDVPPLL